MVKTSQHLRRGSRTAEVLCAIEFVAEALSATRRHPYAILAMGFDGYRSLQRDQEQYARQRALRSLAEQRLIKLRRVAAGYKVILTDKGARERYRLRILAADLFEDDRMTMVVFDVPETERRLRRMIRELLSEASFLPIQRSVWLSPFNAVQELTTFFNTIGKSHWIRVFEVKELTIT